VTSIVSDVLRRSWLVAIGAIAECGLSLSAVGLAGGDATATGVACGPSAARTLAHDAVARVYASGGNAYGCVVGRAGKIRLGAVGLSPGRAHIEAVRVAGRIAAYGLLRSGVDTGVAIVNVRRLTTGKLLAQRPATTRVGVEGFRSVDSLVLKSDGAVAWIATARSIGPPKFIRQVQLLDGGGFRRLDSGPEVVASSLTLHRSRLSWKHGAATRTATLR
jgi:hypothetical protein